MPGTDRDAVLGAIPATQRTELAALDAAIRSAGPSLEVTAGEGQFAYGRYAYRYASGRAGEWSTLSLVPRKHGLSLYVSVAPVEQWKDRMPGADCGKGCIRLKRASDMPADVLDEIVAKAVAADGRLLDWTGRDQAGEPAISDR
jgi:hypothetical protein